MKKQISDDNKVEEAKDSVDLGRNRGDGAYRSTSDVAHSCERYCSNHTDDENN